MMTRLKADMDTHLAGMDCIAEENCVSYAGAVEMEGAVVGVSLLFFGEDICRMLVQLTEVPEEKLTPALRLCGHINQNALYKATLEQGIFMLTLDLLLDEQVDSERLMGHFYAMLDGARLYHLDELREIVGELSGALPPPDDASPLN